MSASAAKRCAASVALAGSSWVSPSTNSYLVPLALLKSSTASLPKFSCSWPIEAAGPVIGAKMPILTVPVPAGAAVVGSAIAVGAAAAVGSAIAVGAAAAAVGSAIAVGAAAAPAVGSAAVVAAGAEGGAAAGVDPQAASSSAAITPSAKRNLNRMVFSFKH